MIHATPPPTPAHESLLAQLDLLRSALNHEVGRRVPWDGTLRREARIAAITGSTSIEGFSVPDEDAAELVDGQPPGSDDAARWAVASYARAMEHVQVMSDDPAFRWLDRVVLDLHFDACGFQRDKSPGRWRTGHVFVTASDGSIEYTAPPADEVPSRMSEVIEWLEDGDLERHVVVRAAMAHLHVVSVHPFSDGNGRMSRLVQSLVLAREGLLSIEFSSIEPYLANHTPEYYHQLQIAHGEAYDPQLDATDWVTFCIEAHIDQATRRLDLFRKAASRWSVLEQLVADRNWPERLVIALEQGLMGGTSRQSYVREANVSVPTANLDLRRLVDAGWLVPQGRGRASRYVASPALRAAVLTTDERGPRAAEPS